MVSACAAAVLSPGTFVSIGSVAMARSSVLMGDRLVVSKVGKHYGGMTVLDEVDLTVGAGEVVALTGENGAGKSTLIRICAGLVRADRGQVRIGGRVGYCPQTPGLFELLSADDHLIMFGRGAGISRSESLDRGHQILEEFGYPLHERAPTRNLSGGTRQKLNLALALLTDPSVLLLDEPYQGFDRGTYVNFWDHCQRWRSEDKAVVVATHMLAELERADRVVELPAHPSRLTHGGRGMKALKRVVIMTEMHGRDLTRRYVALGLLIALPLSFYLTSGRKGSGGISAGGIGMAFAVSGASLFSVLSSSEVDQRLVLGGYRPVDLLLGRLLFLGPLGLVIAAGFSGLMIALSHPAHPWLVVLGVGVVAVESVPLGLAIGAVVPHELEGTLVLIGVVGVQLAADRSSTVSKVLPFYGPRQILAASTDPHGLLVPLLQTGAYALGLLLVARLFIARRVDVIQHRLL